jgi:DNA integrity scanning protein DisA with diadenylate cyclase activity
MMATLSDLADELVTDVDGLMLFSPSSGHYKRYSELDDGADVIVISQENDLNADTHVKLPLKFDDIQTRLRYGIEGAMDHGIVNDGDVVACSATVFGDDADSLVRLRVDDRMRSGVYALFADSRADPGVIRSVFEVAIELGKKGQKGKPVGALFVVGDAGKVMNKSRPLSYNPFEKSHVHVGDPIVNVMLKEFSRLDGAFVISDGGKIVSAYRYLEPSAEGVDIPKGLGARHMAGGAITRDTNATSIVLSESDGLVRAFKAGQLTLELDPEDY